MDNLTIKETSYIPTIILDSIKGVFSIKGKSYPENTFEVYQPVQKWIKEYFSTTSNINTIINFELTYLNSSSLKVYFDMFDMLELAVENGKFVEVNWFYESDDDIIEEIGEELQEEFHTISIKLIPHN